MNNFVVIESIYGKFIVNRHCDYQAEALIKTGATHIEPELRNMFAIVNTLPEGAIAVDAGANIGFVSVPIARALQPKGGKVYAFEVQEMLYYALCGTVALNDLDNLKVFNRGLGNDNRRISVPKPNYSVRQDFGTYSLVDTAPGADQSSSTVEIVKIDDQKFPRLDFLKIDVEGMELEVLEGAIDSINSYRPWCWIEYHKVPAKRLRAFFADKNYTLYRIDTLNILCAPNDKLSETTLVVDAPVF